MNHFNKCLTIAGTTLIFILIMIPFGKAQAQQIEKINQELENYTANHPMVGLAVVVVKDNKIIYSNTFGKKDLTKNIPLDTSDLFRIASISKSFTVTSLMQLVQKKQIKLDEDVSKLIGFQVRNPFFPNKVITLRMILSHTSSISDKNGYFNLDVINPDVNKDYTKSYNDYEPGTQYEYCNLCLNMAGTILERVSNERFDHYIPDHILKPLGIYGGYNVNDLNSNLFANLYEYDTLNHQFQLSEGAYEPRTEAIAHYKFGYSTPIFSPTGGMKISVGGLAKYMMMHLNYGELNGVRIITKKSEKEMRKPELKGDPHQYGLGLFNTTDLIPNVKLVGHTGDAYGLFSSMFFQPKEKFGFVVITNGAEERYEGDFQFVIKDVNNILYQDFIKK